MRMLAIWTLTCFMSASTSFAKPPPKSERPAVVLKWLNTAAGGAKSVAGLLHLIRFREPTYILTKPITWLPDDPKSKHKKIIVPAGFVTDFASVPWVFWSTLRPDGNYAYAAVVHDYLYWTQKRSRKDADEIFRKIMTEFGVSAVKVEVIYRAVRTDAFGWGGGPVWREVSKRLAAGERRILRRYPSDPRTSWREWKNKPGVFVSE